MKADAETGLAVTKDPSNSSIPNLSGVPSASVSTSSEEGRRSSQFHRHKWMLTVLILLLGSAASAAFLAVGIKVTRKDHEQDFQREASEFSQSIESAMRDYELFGLWVHQDCFQSFPNNSHIELGDGDIASHLGYCSREDFHRLYRHIASVGVEFNSIQFLPNITHENRETYETQQGNFYNENYPDFDYQGIKTVGSTPEAKPLFGRREKRAFYFPVMYVEPIEPNLVTVDIDVYSDFFIPTIEKALSSWRTALSDRISLLNFRSPDAYGIVLQHPGISVPGHSRSTALAQIVIRIPDFLRVVTEGLMAERSFYLYDATTPSTLRPPVFLGAVQVRGSERIHLPEQPLEKIPRTSSSYTFQREFHIADRRWVIVVVSDADEYQPELAFIIAGGCVMCLAIVLVALWLFTSLNRVDRIHQIRSEAEVEKSHTAQRQAREERQLNEFMAHEVRNPLSAAISALSFVKTGTQDTIPQVHARESMLNDIGIAESSLQYIDELLRNMLDAHRATCKHIKLELCPTNVASDVLKPVASLLFMRDAKVKVQVDCRPEELFVNSDRIRLKQVVLNLATNAAKFVEQGFILLRGSVSNGSVEISVEDSGPCISQERRAHLFETNQESLDTLEQGAGIGIGIGLSICKKLCDLMGADLFLDESYNSGVVGRSGSRFFVRLNQPALLDCGITCEVDTHEPGYINHKTKSSTAPTRTADNKSGSFVPGMEQKLPEQMSVLFVDDDPMLRKMFTRALERVCPRSWDIQKACNGETALRMVESQHFDLIFIDQYMTAVEKQLLGTETVLALRSKGVTSIICGLSANDLKNEFVSAGADTFMSKPFPCEPDALETKICQILEMRSPGTPDVCRS